MTKTQHKDRVFVIKPSAMGCGNPPRDAAAGRILNEMDDVDMGGNAREASILVVEDEEMLSRLFTNIIGRFGCEVEVVADGEEALELVRTGRCEPDLLITDLTLPGMDGGQLASRMLELRPDIQVLYMSGREPDARNTASWPYADRFLAKPFTPEELRRKIGEIVPI